MIDYKSYESVNGVPFGASEEEVIKVFGEPDSRDDNVQIALYYKDFTIHLNANGFFYIGISPFEKVVINGKIAGWTLKEVADIIKMDSHPVVDDADIILHDLGVDFINFHDIEDDDTSERVIAFFAKGVMKHYESEKPFRLIENEYNPNNALEIIDEHEETQEKNNKGDDIIPDDFFAK